MQTTKEPTNQLVLSSAALQIMRAKLKRPASQPVDPCPSSSKRVVTEPPFYTVSVMPKNYPQDMLSIADLSLLEEAIIDEVVVAQWNTALSFKGIHFKNGYLIIDCTDKNSADWLMTVSTRLESWNGVPLVGIVTTLPYTISIFCPKSVDRSNKTLLVLLKNQNKIHTDSWRIFLRKEEKGGVLLNISIDKVSQQHIIAKGHHLSFCYGSIPVFGLKKGENVDPIAKDILNYSAVGEIDGEMSEAFQELGEVPRREEVFKIET